MPLLHYAKVNINSNIYEVYNNKEVSIEGIMKELFDSINDTEEYLNIDSREFIDGEGELRKIELREIYNFSELEKELDVNKMYIFGKLVRRYPIYTEEFDEATRTSRRVVLENNSISTLFYFDLRSEIIVFSERQKLGSKQFIEAFENLLDICHEKVGFELFLLKDPYSMKERLERAHKITKIKATVIPPNVNEEALEDLYNKEVQDMEEANITKKTSLFEVHEKSAKGINVKAKLVQQVMDSNEAYGKYAKGYGKLEVEGEHSDGTPFKFDSDEDSPYQTQLPEREKGNFEKFKEYCQKGITIFLAKKTIDKFKDKKG